MTETYRCALVQFDGTFEFVDATQKEMLKAAMDYSTAAERGTDWLDGGVSVDYSHRLDFLGEDPRKINTIAETMAQILWRAGGEGKPPGSSTNERYHGTVVFRASAESLTAKQQSAIREAHREAVDRLRARGWTVPDGALKSLNAHSVPRRLS
ncbi:hypothetical protein [Streptomyces sp. NPDC057496]|uniref:hypothetical protein n=1 Tax=Streptomyces sp. NPDC057496 TaxID=3346149 RepID=UPI0036764533